MSQLRLEILFKAIDRVTGPVKRISAGISRLSRASGLDRVGRAAARTGKGLKNVVSETGALLAKVAALGGGAGYLFKTLFVDTAAKFEKFTTILETVEGSSAKAKKAMDWISDFATTTPYELDEITAAFVRLKAFGLDPTDGLLRTLGDTAAGMGEPIMKSVEAIADAVTGENERLKEFGIKASKQGDHIVYRYKLNGEEMVKAAKANSSAQIQATLTAIWNEKYAGNMDKLSKTWDGMTSNLMDQWTRFANKVMAAGVFDWMKTKLAGILAQIDRLAESGELQAWAERIGTALTENFQAAWETLPQVWEGLKQLGEGIKWLADLVGGWKNLAIALGVALAGPLIAAMTSLGIAIGQLGVAMLATPIGWIVAGIAALAGATYLVWKQWEPLGTWFSNLWGGIKSVFAEGVLFVLEKIQSVMDALPDFIKSKVGLSGIEASLGNTIKSLQGAAAFVPAPVDWKPLDFGGFSLPTLGGQGGGNNQFNGKLAIEVIDKAGNTRIRELRSDNLDMDVDVGYAMGGL